MIASQPEVRQFRTKQLLLETSVKIGRTAEEVGGARKIERKRVQAHASTTSCNNTRDHQVGAKHSAVGPVLG